MPVLLPGDRICAIDRNSGQTLKACRRFVEERTQPARSSSNTIAARSVAEDHGEMDADPI